MREIKTSHVYPPIPVRQFDWCAWFDDVGEEGPNGWGRTEQEAISDLMDNNDSGGPTEDKPNRPTCSPDGSCCDFVCGN